MDVYLLLIVLANLLFYISSLTCVWLMRRRMRSLEDSDFTLNRALREALIDEAPASEHRVDAATSEAESGFLTCPSCAFANFTRFHYCVLCGERLSATITAAPALSHERASSRRARARRRSEWTRKLDVEGPTSTPEPPVVPDDATSSAASVVVKRSERLHLAAASTVLELVSAGDADASAFADGSDLGSRERMRETLEMATKDFPTKYAHFVVSTASLLVPAEVEFLKLSVHRAFVVEESVDHLSCIDEKHMRSFMRINFVDESGVDAGGVHREWFMLLNELIVGPAAGVFMCVNARDQTFYLDRASRGAMGEDRLTYFYAVGRLVGRALLEGEALGFHLSLPLIKIILGIPVSFSDLEYFDPEAFRSMQWLLTHDGVDALGLDFSVTERRGDGEMVTVDLVENGRNIAVTDANKREYLDRRLRYTLFESVSSQLYMFLKGLYEVVPTHLLALFDPEEFDYVLCGSDEIDVTDWEMHSKHSKSLRRARVRRWFWELVREMPNEYRRRLLQFATGCSRVPLVGFKGLTSVDGRICPFTLKGVAVETSGQYIRSHACFNRLDLPLYTDRSALKRILYATLETEAYGFTTA